MKIAEKFAAVLAIAALPCSTAHAAAVIGEINFSSGGNGGIVLQDALGNTTTTLADAKGIKSWVFPQVDAGSGSFASIPFGQAVVLAQPWIFEPSTPATPLWSISGLGNFTFALTSSTVEFHDADFLLISANGILDGDDFDPTPATWFFSAQSPAADGKFSWSSTTLAVPEPGASALVGLTLLVPLFQRRRNRC